MNDDRRDNRYLILPRRIAPSLAVAVAFKYGASVKVKDGQIALVADAPGVLEGAREELGMNRRIIRSQRWDEAPFVVTPHDLSSF